jgi:hypothetical protein
MKFFNGIDDLETEKEEIYNLPALPARDTLMMFICDEIKKKGQSRCNESDDMTPTSQYVEKGQWI